MSDPQDGGVGRWVCASTTDPAAVAAIEAAHTRLDQARAAALAWAAGHGATSYVDAGAGLVVEPVGLPTAPIDPTHWGMVSGGVWRPDSGTKAEQQMLGLRVAAPTIPGIPDKVMHTSAEETVHQLLPVPFAVNGTGYVYLGAVPDPDCAFGSQWVECSPDTADAALAELNARRAMAR